MNIKITAISLLLFASTAGAQIVGSEGHNEIPLGPPAAFVESMPEDGPLWLDFCLIGDHICVERKALVWGQVCDSKVAKITSENGETYEGLPVLPGFHYAGWHCRGRFHDKSERVFGGGNWGD